MKKYLLSLMLVAVALSGCSVVGPGQRGIRVSLGKASNEPLPSGGYLWFPFLLGMSKMNVQTQKSDVETSSTTHDLQEIQTHVAVNYSVTPDRVVDVYRNVGTEDDILDRILVPAVNEVLKAEMAKLTAEEILTKRMELKANIDLGLKERLAKNGITFSDLSIVNLTFSKDFSDAIEAKQIAEQEAKRASYVAQKATEEAKAEVERAKGKATSQQLLRASLTPEILQKTAIDKWDGHFPQYMGGSGTLPFVNIKMSGKSRSASTAEDN